MKIPFVLYYQIGNKMKTNQKKTYFNITDLDVLFIAIYILQKNRKR